MYITSSTLTLFDDESVREKLTVMDKIDAIWDDERNKNATDALEKHLEQFLTLGKSYQIIVEEVEQD